MRKRRPTTPVLISLVLHVVLGAGLVRVLLIPVPLRDLFTEDEAPRAERIGFIALPQRGPANAGRDGGDGRRLVPESQRRPARALVAPGATPSALPAAPAAGAPDAGGGSGERIGAGGPTQGIRPSYGDPRVWVPPAEIVQLPRTPAQRLDSALKSRVQRMQDSVAIAQGRQPSKFERGDWTFGKDGRWGVDDKGYIRLGKFSLPSAVLGLLPLNMNPNVSGNPSAIERERALARVRSDIQFQSQRMLNEEELRLAARRIRERKDRERRERQDAAGQGAAPEGRE